MAVSELSEDVKFIRLTWFNNVARAKSVYLPSSPSLEKLTSEGIGLCAKVMVRDYRRLPPISHLP